MIAPNAICVGHRGDARTFLDGEGIHEVENYVQFLILLEGRPDLLDVAEEMFEMIEHGETVIECAVRLVQELDDVQTE